MEFLKHIFKDPVFYVGTGGWFCGFLLHNFPGHLVLADAIGWVYVVKALFGMITSVIGGMLTVIFKYTWKHLVEPKIKAWIDKKFKKKSNGTKPTDNERRA